MQLSQSSVKINFSSWNWDKKLLVERQNYLVMRQNY